jgi:hypothetical protein
MQPAALWHTVHVITAEQANVTRPLPGRPWDVFKGAHGSSQWHAVWRSAHGHFSTCSISTAPQNSKSADKEIWKQIRLGKQADEQHSVM